MEYTPVFSSNNDNTISFDSRPTLVNDEYNMQLWVLQFMRDEKFIHIDDYHIVRHNHDIANNKFWASQNSFGVVMCKTEDFVMMKLKYG
jgi:hypothetical protein